MIPSSQEAFEKEEFSGRPGNFSGTFFQKGKTGITTTEGRKLFFIKIYFLFSWNAKNVIERTSTFVLIAMLNRDSKKVTEEDRHANCFTLFSYSTPNSRVRNLSPAMGLGRNRFQEPSLDRVAKLHKLAGRTNSGSVRQPHAYSVHYSPHGEKTRNTKL
jgi:hypothetical protein